MTFGRVIASGSIASLALAGCARFASVDSAPRGIVVVDVPAPQAALVRRNEIAPYAGQALGDALLRLRPEWLRADPSARGAAGSARALIYIDDVPVDDASALRTTASDAVVEARLLSPVEARTRYGPTCRCPAGVILVRTRS